MGKPRRLTLAAAIAACALLVAMPAPSMATLSIDINDVGTPDLTQTGFDAFLIDAEDGTPVTNTYGPIDVTLYDIGGGFYKDRLRSYPLNDGAFTESDLLRDFVFANDSSGGGMNLKVTGLTPFGVYSGSIWSLDDASTGVRMSDWIANGTVIKNNYVFDGADTGNGVSPPSNDTYRIDFTATASADGTIMFQGRHEKRSDGVSVMLNALQLTQTGTLQRDTAPVVSVDFGSGTAMSGFTQVDLASATAGATVGGKTITVRPAGQFSQAPSYEAMVAFWDSVNTGSEWGIQAGLASDALTAFDSTNSIYLGHPQSDRRLYLASLGTVTPAQVAAGLQVYMDDLDPEGSETEQRTWLDSVVLKRTDTGQLFQIALDDTNTVGEFDGSPVAPWWDTSDDAPDWRKRNGYGWNGGPIYQCLGDRDDALLTTTLSAVEPDTTAVSLFEDSVIGPANDGDFDQQDLLNDFIGASNGDVDTSGLDVLVEDLMPGQEYSVTIWAFDDTASESTRSNWSANGVLVNDGYRFDPDQDPMTNYEYSFSFLTSADENGEILIEGRVAIDGTEGLAPNGNVYLNAMEIYAVVPEPSTIILLATLLLGGFLAWQKK